MKVRSFTQTDRYYWTTPARCSCPDHVYRQPPNGCKHQKLVKSIYAYASAWSNRTEAQRG